MDRHPTAARSRRDFLRLGAGASLPLLIGPSLARAQAQLQAPAARQVEPGEATPDPWRGLKMGIATYTFSQLPLDVAIAGIKRVGVHYASIKDAHLAMKSTAEERQAVTKKFRDAGITPLSCGVISPKGDEAALRAMFDYARDAGIPTIVCKPVPESLSTIDKLIREYDIRVAIHNHGPEDKVWPSPIGVWDAIQPFDPRLGLCIDVGHTARCGVDPAEAIRKCAPRLHDLHIKDIAVPSGGSKPVELGRGILDLAGILQALIDVKFAGHVGLEYEKDMKDPLAGVAESIGYLKGLLRSGRTA